MIRWCIMTGTLRNLAVRVRCGGGATTAAANCVLMYYSCISRLVNVPYEMVVLSTGACVSPKGALQPARGNAGATREGQWIPAKTHLSSTCSYLFCIPKDVERMCPSFCHLSEEIICICLSHLNSNKQGTPSKNFYTKHSIL